MRSFVLRARAASTNSQIFLENVGKDAHSEILAHTIMNAIFTAQSHRDDVIVHLVLESTTDYSRTISLTASQMTNIGGFHEAALISVIVKALNGATNMQKEETRQIANGIIVRAISFEHLIRELGQTHSLYILDKKGSFIREIDIAPNPCFLLTDHIPMPKKTFNLLDRLGVTRISLGNKMLFASQCVVLIHNDLDLV